MYFHWSIKGYWLQAQSHDFFKNYLFQICDGAESAGTWYIQTADS